MQGKCTGRYGKVCAWLEPNIATATVEHVIRPPVAMEHACVRCFPTVHRQRAAAIEHAMLSPVGMKHAVVQQHTGTAYRNVHEKCTGKAYRKSVQEGRGNL